MRLNVKAALVLLICLGVLGDILSAQVVKPLTTDKAQVTINSVWIGCEGASCVGLTIDNTAGGVSLTSAQYNPTVTDLPSGLSRAQIASCINSGAKIWVTDSPTASLTLASGRGKFINDGGSFVVYGYEAISKFRAIRDAAVSSTLLCDYYRQP